MKKEAFKFNPSKRYKVYFNDQTRTPIYGKFVQLKDYEEMFRKGFIRFVSASHLDEFEVDGHVRHSRLFCIADFKSFKTVEHETV